MHASTPIGTTPSYKTSVGNREGKSPFGKHASRWKDITLDFKEIHVRM